MEFWVWLTLVFPRLSALSSACQRKYEENLGSWLGPKMPCAANLPQAGGRELAADSSAWNVLEASPNAEVALFVLLEDRVRQML